ncbi:hypothetical protein BKA82DRAFT_4017477 [Pisolithus tinctorius]|nr:hypothetical protein BKA82DRAFT_4017477 [Pisolithus tinctorius]
MSDETLKSWTQVDPTNIEAQLSEEIASASSPSHHVLANRALIRVRLKHLALAIEDTKEPSPIGHIAMAVALLGQGNREGALHMFDLAFHDCEPHNNRFLLLLKSILVFKSGNQEEAMRHVVGIYRHVLGVMYMKTSNYECIIPLIEHAKHLAPKDKQCPPLLMILLIFGWNFNGFDIIAQQHLCETFFTEQCAAEAMDILLNIIRTSDEETLREKTTADWIAANGMWEDALQDANMAVKVDPSNPWGYETKYLVLHGAKQYNEVIYAFKSMLQAIEQSNDSAIRHIDSCTELRKNYVSPSESIGVIDRIVHEILKNCPLVIIHVTSGCLCDGAEWMHIFKADPSFKELVSSMTTEIDNEQIL